MGIKQIISLVAIFTFVSCDMKIKNTDAIVKEEAGTQIDSKDSDQDLSTKTFPNHETHKELLGNWVGYFERNDQESLEDKSLYVDEGFVWTRENKINISVDEIKDSLVIGHSVVAGNDRPFEGTMHNRTEGGYAFEVKEPGDHKYDGTFSFTIHEDRLTGTWVAYKNIDIKKRKYDLEKRRFKYDPDVNLERTKEYVNWDQFVEKKERFEMDENEFEEWVSREFATATDLIYTVNASNALLEKEQVENLKRGDLTIIRNTIYARHGYSFKNRPLRVFFDAQSWYIPVHTDIKSDFTELERKNIELLLRYEKNASEYYDSFGRG